MPNLLHTAEVNGRSVSSADPWTIVQTVIEPGVVEFSGQTWSDRENGVTTPVVVAYQFNPETFDPAEAMAWALDKKADGVRVTRFTPADESAIISFSEGENGEDIVTIEAEVLKDGEWNASTGKFVCNEKMRKAIIRGTHSAWAKLKNFSVVNKLTHSDDQTMARELFATDTNEPMGTIDKVWSKGKSLWVRAQVPLKVSKAIDAKLIFERSVELAKNGNDWIMTGLAWLGNTAPAVKGLSDIKADGQVVALIAPPRIREIKKLSELVPGEDVAEKPKSDKETGESGSSGESAEKPAKTTPKQEEPKGAPTPEETTAMDEATREMLVSLAERQIDGYTHTKLTVDQAKSQKAIIASMASGDDPKAVGDMITAQLDTIAGMQDLKPAGGDNKPKPKAKVNASEDGDNGEDGTLDGDKPKKHALSAETRSILKRDEYASKQNQAETHAPRSTASAILRAEANEILRKEIDYLDRAYAEDGGADLGNAIVEASIRNPGIAQIEKLNMGLASSEDIESYKRDPGAFIEAAGLLDETEYKVEDLQLA